MAEGTTSSLPPNMYVPQATPQSMYGLSGQQFVPQINITGSSSGVKINNPYFDKSEVVGEEQLPSVEPVVAPVIEETSSSIEIDTTPVTLFEK